VAIYCCAGRTVSVLPTGWNGEEVSSITAGSQEELNFLLCHINASVLVFQVL